MRLIALLLDLANIVGGFLLAGALFSTVPRIGPGIGRGADRLGAVGWVVGVVALVTGGYYLIKHLVEGPHLFHFEVVAIAVGVVLLWDRLTGRPPLLVSNTERTAPASDAPSWAAEPGQAREPSTVTQRAAGPAYGPTGGALLLAVFGLIAIIVGIQGLFTPDG